MNKNIIIAKIQSSRTIQCYLLLALPTIGFFVFTLYPILWAFSKSFFYYKGSDVSAVFTGVENFINTFKDAKYWSSWIFTLKFTVAKMVIEIPLALVLAFVLSKLKKGSGFFRGAYYIPNVISIAIVGVIFTNLFDSFGFINGILKIVNIQPIDWFAQTSTATAVLVFGSVWASIGINVLYFSAALTNVPEEIYEATSLDGAGGFTNFFKITVPMIAPVFQTILLLAINGTLHVSEYIIAVTNGAPGGTTHTVGSYIITKFLPGFSANPEVTPNIGYGCAMSIITSIIYALVAWIYMRASKKMSEVY